MQLRPNQRAGWVAVALLALGASVSAPAFAAPAKKAPAKPKPTAKATAKPAAKPGTVAGKTATETVKNLIGAMQKKDRAMIATAFNWQRFAAEMNKLIPGQGLDATTYKTLLVETLDVEKKVSADLRVGQETKKGTDTATVEMRRVFPAGAGEARQVRTINILTLAKEKDVWRIIKLDSAQTVTAPPPPVRQAPQGMVPAAGSESPGR